jgi:hypothetical protein
MKTVTVRDYGVDMGNEQTFGDVLAIAYDSRCLITLRQPKLKQPVYSLNYRITDDGYIQLIMIVNGTPTRIVAQLTLEGETLQRQLQFALIGYMIGTGFWWGFPEFIISPIFSKDGFDQLVSMLTTIRESNRAITIKKKTPLVLFIEKSGLIPIPDYWKQHKWLANCPDKRVRHALSLSTVTDHWECTICSRKGNLKDFRNWMKEINRERHHLSHPASTFAPNLSGYRININKFNIMEPKQKVYNLIILDESGSMQSIRKPTIAGFNEVVQTIKGMESKFPEQEYFISLVSFNGMGIREILFNQAVKELVEIDESKYRPDSFTPLFDAMGFGLTKQRDSIEQAGPVNVLVTVLTDGEENASAEYRGDAIAALVAELKLKGWIFTYIGANHDVESFAMSINITNTMTFQANEADMKEMFVRENEARGRFGRNIRDKKASDKDFYKEDGKI